MNQRFPHATPAQNLDAVPGHPDRGRKQAAGKLCLLLLGLLWLGGCGGSPARQVTLPPPQPAPSVNEQLARQLQLYSAKTASSYRDYQVGPEDLLDIDVYGQEKLRREVRVNGEGYITMPLVGPVKVAGLTAQEIERRLAELYGSQYLRNPQITVHVKEFHHQRVAVTGAVEKPGSYEIIGPRTLLEVLALAGGFSSKPKSEAGDVIHVIRKAKAGVPGSGQTLVIDLKRLISGQAPELNVLIEAGDVVHVPFAGTAYVLGGVKKPGNVLVKDRLTVSQAIAMAGGIDPLLGTKQIIIMRFDPQGQPIRIETNLNDITSLREPDLPVQENDVIVVREGELKKKVWTLRQVFPLPSGGYSIPTQ